MKQKLDIETASGQRNRTDGGETRAPRPTHISREAVLIVCLVLLVVMFAITAVVSRLYHRKIHQLGDQWFARGEASFRSRNISTALIDYRNALVYSPSNSVFQLHLAQALAGAGREEEARSYLINLLAESPGAGEINLELARVAAQEGAPLEAIRYYHGAIYGVWENNPLLRRLQVRRELCQYLLDRGDLNDAQPEIIALTQEVPTGDIQREKEAGQFLLRVGLWTRALAEFQIILKSNHHDADALEGAGTAAFRQGQYIQALAYFEKLSREKAVTQDVAPMFETVQQIESADPFLPGLSNDEQAKRTAKALAQAASRASGCAQKRDESATGTDQKPPAANGDKSNVWSETNLRRHPDRVDAAMSQVFEAENIAAQKCGEPRSGPDKALWLLGRSRGVRSR